MITALGAELNGGQVQLSGRKHCRVPPIFMPGAPLIQ